MPKRGTKGIWAQTGVFIAIGLASLAASAMAFVCPNVIEVLPCECNSGFAELNCQGPAVTQDALDRVLTAVRRKNNGALQLWFFYLRFTKLVEIDLTPFEGGTFTYMYFENNTLLSRVVGPNSSDLDPIKTWRLHWNYNSFQDEGLQTMLHHFSSADIVELSLSGNELTGSLGQEFLPGFSDLSGVSFLYLSYNNIRSIGGGQFRGMSSLSIIEMDNNGLEEIGEDAFLIDGHEYPVSLYLSGNNLTDDCFHPSSGISKTNWEVHLFLENNLFQRVRKDPFENFLETHLENRLNFTGNPIWCDPDMKWLKDRREEFERKVTGLNCVNDPGQTVFTSSQVSGCSRIGNSFRLLSIESLIGLFCLFLLIDQ